MRSELVYSDQFDPELLKNMRRQEFDEVSSFRKAMKGVEELATSGMVTRPGAEIAGRRVRIVHRMGDRFDVQVKDPFTKSMQTVVSHQYDLRGRRTGTQVAWKPGDPYSVAAVFGVPFVSAFGDTPKDPPENEQEEAAIKRAVAEARRKHKIAKAVKLEQARLEALDAKEKNKTGAKSGLGGK